MSDTRLSWSNALLAAAAYHRVGWSWARIGKHLGYDKDRLRKAVTEDAQQRQQTGLPAAAPSFGGHPMSAFIKRR